jgi:hypothetical protein
MLQAWNDGVEEEVHMSTSNPQPHTRRKNWAWIWTVALGTGVAAFLVGWGLVMLRGK